VPVDVAASGRPMTGAPPFGPDNLVTLAHWQDPPGNRWAFQHVRELVPSAAIRRRTGPVWQLPRAEQDVMDLVVASGDGTTTVGDHLAETQTDGFLVLHRGHVVVERYFNNMEPDTRHLLMSVSKSVTGAVAGCLVGRGLLDVDALVTEVLPELSGSSFDGATVQQLLDMRTGTRFDETYDDPAADVRVYEQVYLWRPRVDPELPPDALTYFGTLENDGDHGGPFRYRSILFDVLAWVLERVGGARFHELVSSEIWAPMGAEFDAEVTVDGHGNAMADGGISATLRDVGRFGLLFLPVELPGRPEVLSPAWIADTVRGAADGSDAFEAGDWTSGFPAGAHYRNGWWVADPAAPFFYGSGIYGQNVFVHGPTQTVVVKLSTWPTPLGKRAIETTVRAVTVIGSHLESSFSRRALAAGPDVTSRKEEAD
jgi:CubicO group peptidase (beta-lactamase class C family)